MNIHSYEKLWLGAAMLLIVVFIATITYGAVGLGIAMVDDAEETISPGDVFDDDRFGEPRVEQVGEDEYEVYVRAQTFTYNPNEIVVPENSEVTFYVTSPDVIHSFSVVGTNINTMVIPGEISTMTVEFDDPGEYGIVCNEYCGSGHHDMEGKLYVVSEDEFDLTELEADAAADEVDLEDDVEIEATIENRQLEAIDATIEFELGEESQTETVTIDGQETIERTFTVPAADLGEGDHDWTVTVDDYEESGTVSVVDGLEDDEDGDDESDDQDADDGDDTETDDDEATDDADTDGGDDE